MVVRLEVSRLAEYPAEEEGEFPPFKDVASRETDGPISSGRGILFAQRGVHSCKSESYIHILQPPYPYLQGCGTALHLYSTTSLKAT